MPDNLCHRLRCHPAAHCPAIDGIEAGFSPSADGGLTFSYRLRGDPAALAIPAPRRPAPADELWRHTCCEAFIAAPEGTQYDEFNFSPSGLWAAYRFPAYRQRDLGYLPPAAPRIDYRTDSGGFRLDVRLPAALLPTGRRLVIGLSAVVEDRNGGKTYWALTHAAPDPDFHLRQSFTLALDIPPT